MAAGGQTFHRMQSSTEVSFSPSHCGVALIDESLEQLAKLTQAFASRSLVAGR